MPTSASDSAGLSLIPSPTIATTLELAPGRPSAFRSAAPPLPAAARAPFSPSMVMTTAPLPLSPPFGAEG
jgi:hypothetical protein